MGEGKPTTSSTPGAPAPDAISTPIDMDTHQGGAASSYGANTNLDAHLEGGPATAADRAATDEIEQQHEQQGTPAPDPRP
ncbi:hypothetical protein GCM10010840_31520 [Deinococcus aerolatus]|uniref:Uncharacterized protein n=1 Tax=Deinococcus aerolatus TaxID=522487 RepID=A0ABQ2GF01_9DEIO|nr:hypothetical protein [Deinococcus aerolatus]GGL91108.1 hypothetical protein GCM10010840_31520 [Deinococcus aerolatus]